jgi:hypothetical protein
MIWYLSKAGKSRGTKRSAEYLTHPSSELVMTITCEKKHKEWWKER